MIILQLFKKSLENDNSDEDQKSKASSEASVADPYSNIFKHDSEDTPRLSDDE